LKGNFVRVVALFVFFSSTSLLAQEQEKDTKTIVASSELLRRAKLGNIDQSTVERLIVDGADVNVKDAETGATPLMFLASYGPVYSELIKLLIENDADVNAQDNEGRTPAMYSAMNFLSRYTSLPSYISLMLFRPKPNFDDLKTLVDMGADLDIQDNEGRTVTDRILGRVKSTLASVEANKYKVISSFEISAYEAWEPTMLNAIKKFEAERSNDQNSNVNEEGIEIKIKDAEAQAKIYRDMANRQMMEFYTYGATGLNVSNVKLVDDFLSKILFNISSLEDSESFNYAVGSLFNKDLLNFLESIEMEIATFNPSYIGAYRTMLNEIRVYNEMKYLPEFSKLTFMRELKNQRAKTLKAVRAYRAR
jgi:ankyrin repeat protein